MPSRSTAKKKIAPASEKGKLKMAERKRILKQGSDGDLVRAFAEKRRK